MTNFYFKLLFITALVCNSNFGFCQSNEIKIKFIGNCGLYLTDGKSNIYIDFPYKSGAHNYMEYDKSELDSIKENSTFIFTHKHGDHYSLKLLNKIEGKKYGPWNISEINKINDSILNFKIEAFKTEHKVFGVSFELILNNLA
jgi:L-ascorbate metabolism protein UlaG (beta-lactamase superfamily)